MPKQTKTVKQTTGAKKAKSKIAKAKPAKVKAKSVKVKTIKSKKTIAAKTKKATAAKATTAKKATKKVEETKAVKKVKPTIKKMSAKDKKESKVKTQNKKTTQNKSVAKKKASPTKEANSVIQQSTATVGLTVVEKIEPYQPKRSEKYMSKNMQEHFRSILIAWKQQLMEEVDRTVHHMQGEAANFPDPSDRATQEEVFSLELRTRDRERKLIKKIEDALNLIDIGEYGYCSCCGEEIGLRRLEARPTAKLCIDCKTLDEIREKQEGI